MTLLFDAFSVYLGPLLEKHAKGKCLVWEDLQASHAATKAFLQTHDNVFVAKKVEDLHKSQVTAYQEAAANALKAWTKSVDLEPMEENDTEDMFVARCVSAAISSAPNWKVDVTRIIGSEIRNLATAAFARYNPPDVGDDDTEEGEDEDGEEGEEDGEVPDEEMGEAPATSDAPKPTEPTPTKGKVKATPKKAAGSANKAKKGTKANKATVRKKGTNAKPGNGRTQASRGKGGATRGRRVAGRGGAAGTKN